MIMNKKKWIIVIVAVIIVGVIVGLYGTFASDSSTDNVYNITLGGDNNEIVVPSNGSKTVIYKVTNTNKGRVKYGIGYSGDNITVKVYDDSSDGMTGYVDYGETKFVKLYIENSGTSDSTASIETILGYEQGGELEGTNAVPSGYSLVSEEYVQYQAVEYLASTGTQYIELDYVPKKNTWVETYLKFSEGNFNGKENIWIFGVRDYEYNDYGFSANFGGDDNQYNILFNWVTSYGGSITGSETFYIINDNYATKQYYRLGNELVQWGEHTVIMPEKPYDDVYNMVIYGIKKGETNEILPFNAHERMYIYDHFNIYEEDKLVMNLVPMYRKVDKKTGFYDLNSSKFYPSSGGELIIGNNKDSYNN